MSKQEQVIQAIKETKVIPVFYHSDIETAKKIVDACYAGGARVFEFTNRGDRALDVFILLKKHIENKYPDAFLGIGSIVNKIQAKQYLDLRTSFIVSPIFSKEVADMSKEASIPWVPGCATPTEMYDAYAYGAIIVKAFPASQLGGPNFIKAVKAPMSFLTIMPTGGVKPTEENLTAWFDAGVIAVGMGSAMISKERIANSQYDEITALMQQSIEIAKNYQ